MSEIRSKLGTGCTFILCGVRGAGKTQIATTLGAERIREAMAKPAYAEDRLPRYIKASDMFREIRASYRATSPLSEMEVVAAFVRPSLLVIDEAQERGESAFEDRTLTHIVDGRYDALRDTIIITNLKREELIGQLGTSISNRVLECGRAIECDWSSFRVRAVR